MYVCLRVYVCLCVSERSPCAIVVNSVVMECAGEGSRSTWVSHDFGKSMFTSSVCAYFCRQFERPVITPL